MIGLFLLVEFSNLHGSVELFCTQGAITTFALRRLLLLECCQVSQVEGHVESQVDRVDACCHQEEASQRMRPFGEKEKAEIPDAKRCKIQRDVKKSVDKVIYNNFSSLINNPIVHRAGSGREARFATSLRQRLS